MLILGRRPGEVIVIGGNITIKILDISRGSVRVGIDAPQSVDVFRLELLDGSGRPKRIRVTRDAELAVED